MSGRFLSGRTGTIAANDTVLSGFRACHPYLDPMPLPKSSTMMLRHEPTLIATTGYQMTASSPRGTFSQAELTAELVTRRIRV